MTWFGRWGVGLEFKKEDMWIGVFWKVERGNVFDNYTEWWVCILPCLPIHIIRQEGPN